jgi:hydroxyacylglutathione hydrolase
MTVQSFTFNPFQENTYVIYDETRNAAIIDPGCYDPAEQRLLDQFILQHNLTIKYLLNTHCHIDHVLGNAHVLEKYKVPFLIHQKEEALLRAVKTYSSNYGFQLYHEALPTGYLTEGEKITFGKTELEVIFLPGHSPGHVGFYHRTDKVILSGDVLFEGSIGRTDLPGGDFNTLIDSIHKKLFILPDDVTVYSGHGDTTTIGEEKNTNPFCALSLIQ